MILGRSAECAAIDALLGAARAGGSGALVLCGDPGIGKTTLVERAIALAGDLQVLSTRGYETESEIPFAGLADLLRPVLDLVPSLPAPQAAALRSALALGPPVAGDRFSVCAATIGILSAAAAQRATLVVIDDLHWLDASSKEAVLFASRRLSADGIALLLATREAYEGESLELRLPRLALSGLSRSDTDELCLDRLPSAPPEIRRRLYEVTAGNPLGVIELAEAWKTQDVQPDGGTAGAMPVPAGSRIERALRARLAGFPQRTRRALLLAGAAVGSETGVVLAAADRCGLTLADFAPAEVDHLVAIDDRRIEFRHPLLRSVCYHAASTDERCKAHAALADALADVPGEAAADARAWHLAAATLAVDDAVADLLEQTAVRARRRTGYIAAARAFVHAARLSSTPARPARLVRAARCWQLAGRNRDAQQLLDQASTLATEPSQRALIQHMSAYIRMWRTRPAEVLSGLVDDAARVQDHDPTRAALMYADTCIPYFMLGQFDQLRDVARRAYDLGQRVGDVAALVTTVAMAGSLTLERRRTEAVLLLRQCQDELVLANPLVRAQDLCHAALIWTWLDGFTEAEWLLDRVIGSARQTGAMGVLPQALAIASELYYRLGRWSDARTSAAESVRLAEETRQANLYALFFAGRMDAVQGRLPDAERVAGQIMQATARLGVDCMLLFTGHAMGLLALGQGDTGKAIETLERVRRLPVAQRLRDPAVVPWAFDLVEAYIRDGRTEDAEALLAQYAPHGDGEPLAQAAAARCRALLAGPDELQDAFDRALAEPALAAMPFERARTELCLGERLRRARQRTQARNHLRPALATFERLGAEPWAQRARAELSATGETVRREADVAPHRLTPQELQVALVVARGASNHEAAAALFLSHKTIEYHLSNIYRKTNIRSRAELATLAS